MDFLAESNKAFIVQSSYIQSGSVCTIGDEKMVNAFVSYNKTLPS